MSRLLAVGLFLLALLVGAALVYALHWRGDLPPAQPPAEQQAASPSAAELRPKPAVDVEQQAAQGTQSVEENPAIAEPTIAPRKLDLSLPKSHSLPTGEQLQALPEPRLLEDMFSDPAQRNTRLRGDLLLKDELPEGLSAEQWIDSVDGVELRLEKKIK